MTTADWALIVSLGSAAISLGSFVWNVWSKFIYPKAKIEVYLSIIVIFQGGESSDPLVSLTATNHGPSDLLLHTVVMRDRPCWLLRRGSRWAVTNPMSAPDVHKSSGPFSGGLPKKLAVGEQFILYFPLSAAKAWLAEAKFTDFGVSDVFGRYHWCPRSNVKSFRSRVSKHFPEAAKDLARQGFWRRSVICAKALFLGIEPATPSPTPPGTTP